MPNIKDMPSAIVGQYMNSGISINYVNLWGIKEALRELIQNAIDGMISFLNKQGGKKSEWNINMVEQTYENIKYRSFIFTWPSKGMTLGKITYIPENEQLILENPGTINKFNLLLGGSGSTKREEKYVFIFLY